MEKVYETNNPGENLKESVVCDRILDKFHYAEALKQRAKELIIRSERTFDCLESITQAKQILEEAYSLTISAVNLAKEIKLKDEPLFAVLNSESKKAKGGR